VCLVLLDDSPEGRRLRDAIQRNYVALDAVTGEHLLVLSTVPPPVGWFEEKLPLFEKLPPAARGELEKQALLLGTDEGQTSARYNSQQLISEFFGDSARAPALVYLELVSASSGEDPDVAGLAFDIGGLANEEALVSAFRYLAGLAKTKAPLSLDSRDFGRVAHCLWNPQSLRWRNAANRTLDAVSFLSAWMTMAKSIRGSQR